MRTQNVAGLVKSAVAAIALAFGGAPAMAQEAGTSSDTAQAGEPVMEPGWTAAKYDRQITCKGVCNEVDSFSYESFVAYTTATDKPGILLSCSARFGLNLTLSWGAVDWKYLIEEGPASSQVKGRDGRVWIDGKRDELTRLLLKRKEKIAQLVGSKYSLEVINAVMKGKPIRLDVGSLADVTYEVPPADDAFRAFIDACPKISSKT